ncbi:histidinol dehydrogenase [Candidatus Palibaumannia cicadellinicola]|uniref:Histidinol dehydrogenase n=1 Tax=Baumannia cicadellinicola subsp. Homalodisca coagulata TaxID=374463 RepID=Q1LT67_BAUCH|nr:histidinol dehydrogenase [Candidatus Baumannia cicadellinicola]ABF13996.1 histidinol dehydrogenase [Baumannia cicadellinicola str. Hc (Homalodisca coagulata)]MBS0032826.1 histidinol dehydrogenase [Candidatus Baumannia cicadellinicola]MCJ7462113.1 histidinol dehydrogenase [Candidatus Baumannia cicadellinicola]MCJ7462686.1 histidinol dehydrogenase [Candidatus Baumannia cicadellinicola]
MINSPLSMLVRWHDYNTEQQAMLLARPALSISENVISTVNEILTQVCQTGDRALRNFNLQFDGIHTPQLRITEKNIALASSRIAPDVKQAITIALTNINRFHRAQKCPDIDLETQPGVNCRQLTKPITSVGLYIPGGLAPLFSTVMMLAIPANIAGCKRIIVCSPPPIADEILYVAQLCGVHEIYQVGGAQAIAAMGFGTQSITHVDKIFGPGNAWVTEAKRQISQKLNGVAVDMQAGPSEIIVIADSNAYPSFIAADLLSQAEHGPDSHVILLTNDIKIAEQVALEIDIQLKNLPRAAIARQALANTKLIIVDHLAEGIAISNSYGPEHLIIQTCNADKWLTHITNAGSIFLGYWSPESAGDYASGTNHVLPTYGYTKTYSGISVADFQKRITVQNLTPQGLLLLASTIETLAQAEQLTAHKNAVTLRVNMLKELS